MESQLMIRSVATEAERTAALRFIERVAFDWYQCAPPPPPEVILAAYAEETIVGTMSLDLGDHEKRLPAEEIWQFDCAKTPLPFERSQLVQYGRWMSEHPRVSSLLVYAAAVYARIHRKETIICEIKPGPRELLRKMDVLLHLVDGARLMVDKIPLDGQPYYMKKPPPELCMVEARVVETACRKLVPEITGLGISFAVM